MSTYIVDIRIPAIYTTYIEADSADAATGAAEELLRTYKSRIVDSVSATLKCCLPSIVDEINVEESIPLATDNECVWSARELLGDQKYDELCKKDTTTDKEEGE